MTENISKTLQFLRHTFDSSEFWKTRPASKAYRYDHTMRVAKYAKTIAEAENLNSEALVVAALLHDVSYGIDFDIKKSPYYNEPCPELEGLDQKEKIIFHGYTSALHSMNFVNSLDFDEKTKQEILFAIAWHTNYPGNSKITGEVNLFTASVRDADEIDHVSGFRFYEDLMKFNFPDATQEDRQQFVWGTKGYTQHHMEHMYLDLRTETAKRLYKENCDYRFSVLENLQSIISMSKDEDL